MSIAVPLRLLAFWRKKPVVRMSASSLGSGAFAMASGVGYFLKSAGVTRLTRSSVHWADRIVAQTSWKGVSRSSSQSTSGYSSSRPSRSERTRAGSGGQRPRVGLRVAFVTGFLTRAATFAWIGIDRRYSIAAKLEKLEDMDEELDRVRREAAGVDVYKYRRRFRLLKAILLGASLAGLTALILAMIDGQKNPCER